MTNSRDSRATDLALNEWLIKEIEKGLKEAEAGDFLTDQELAEAHRRWRAPERGRSQSRKD
jgi:predicted transcriptional regulator